MALRTPVSQAHIKRMLAEVEAGQDTAGATMIDADREIARRQVFSSLLGDHAVQEAIAEALARFPKHA